MRISTAAQNASNSFSFMSGPLYCVAECADEFEFVRKVVRNFKPEVVALKSLDMCADSLSEEEVCFRQLRVPETRMKGYGNGRSSPNSSHSCGRRKC